MFDITPSTPARPVSAADLATVLTAQLIVAWAGEGGDDPRLAWWRSDLVGEYGGKDLFKRLLPATWMWAVLQGAREVARRADAEARRRADDHDRVRSLFSLGFEVDEQIEERLQELKRSEASPVVALPALKPFLEQPWNRDRFLAWVGLHGDSQAQTAPVGRQVGHDPKEPLVSSVCRLVAALAPLSEVYPLPHFRRPT
jgi:hypothetical protein